MCNTAIRGPVRDRATSTRTLGEGPGVLGLGWHRPLGRHGLSRTGVGARPVAIAGFYRVERFSRTGVGVEETKDLAPR